MMKFKDMPTWFRWVLALAAVNFISFLFLVLPKVDKGVGWEAVDGKYYLAGRTRRTEVSKVFYVGTQIQAISVLVGHIFVIVCGNWLAMRREERREDER